VLDITTNKHSVVSTTSKNKRSSTQVSFASCRIDHQPAREASNKVLAGSLESNPDDHVRSSDAAHVQGRVSLGKQKDVSGICT